MVRSTRQIREKAKLGRFNPVMPTSIQEILTLTKLKS